MDALLNSLRGSPGDQVAVCCVANNLEDQITERDGVTYYSVRMPRTGRRRWVLYRDDDDRNCGQIVSRCMEVIAHFRPTLVHIHGTERAYGMLEDGEVGCPVLLSLQGLISVYASWTNTFGDYDLLDVLRFHSLVQTLRGFGPLWDFVRTRTQGARELKVLRAHRYFAGRTEWDRAHLQAIHPEATYFHVGELLRPEFYRQPWALEQVRRRSIFFANGRGPRRNVECLLRAARLLLVRFPDLHVRIAGTDGREDRYSQAMVGLSKKLGLTGSVEFLGPLPASRVAEELRAAHVFILPSRIENSANSLCEAQLMGVPVVTGYMGGTPSLVEEGRTGLFAPNGDTALLADAVRRIFESDSLAKHLSVEARQVALQRHDTARVREQLMDAYQAMLSGTKS